MDINEIEKIIKILKQNDVQEFELNQEGTHIKLTRSGTVVVAPAAAPQYIASAQAPAPSAVAAPSAAEIAAAAAVSNLVAIESPIVGTFYRRPSPDAEPFAKEGDSVRKGDTLCIIEAMKVMNEIEATCDGKISKILLDDGQVVEYGEVLFLIDPIK